MSRDLTVMRLVLASLLPGGERITGVRPLATGHSNETYLIEGLDLILRLPPPATGALLDNHGVIAQARIYQDLGATAEAPPVPQVVMIGEDETLFGAPFFVMERVAGEAIGDYQHPDWFKDGSEALREGVCRDWIVAIAKLANVAPIPALGAVTPAADDLRYWRKVAGTADSPRTIALIDRLLATPAPCSGAPAAVHGDPKLANMMFEESGRLCAVLDFELAQNGDPLYDLGYLLYFFASAHHRVELAQSLPGMFTRDQVIAVWSEVSGRSAEGLAWYEAAALAKICAIVAQATALIDSGRSDDQRFLRFKQNLDRNLDALEATLDAGV
jgi:aminoglycoside phosphotransferase (APT) family kinase protein